MNPPKFSPCLATLLAGLLLTLSINAAPVHETGILLLVPVDTEPNEEQVAQAATEVADVNALDSQAMSMSESQEAIDGANYPAHEQLEWTLLNNEPASINTMPNHDSLANFGSQPFPTVPQIEKR